MRNVAIVAFHVYPDAAVGAKRVSELANHLASDDWQLVVVSHKSSATDPSRHLHESITTILIEQPRPISLRTIERLKRFWPGRARSTEGSSPGLMSAPPRGLSRLIAKIEWHYHRIVGVLDPMKKWSIKVALQFLWNKDLSRAQVIVVSGPPWSPVLAATVVGVCWRRPVLFDLRDPWFERVGESREYTGLRRWADQVCESFCMRVARTVTVTTEAFLRSLAQRYPQHAHNNPDEFDFAGEHSKAELALVGLHLAVTDGEAGASENLKGRLLGVSEEVAVKVSSQAERPSSR